MLSSALLTLSLALSLGPSSVYAGLFPKSSPVKMLDPKGFREAMKLNQTSLVAFVAPWCGHCQRMSPEFEKAAKGLNPLIATYAVDCDDDKNKRLCSEHDVKGFPTVKLFPRGKSVPPMTYEQERTASGFYNFAARRVPNVVKSLKTEDEVEGWVKKHTKKYRAVLYTKDKKVPLLWKALGNKYSHTALEFGVRHLPMDDKLEKARVVVYGAGSAKGVDYTGITKLDPLSAYFESVLDGKADLTPKEKEEVPPKDEL